MRILKRIVPYVVIVAAALLLLYLPDIGPERYTDLATFFRVERARQGYAGFAVAAIKGGAVLYLDGFGTDGAGRPLGPESRILVGAAAKPFAGLAAQTLVREKRLDLDKPVRDYLSFFGFAGGSGGEVRVRDLLAHASGVSDSSFDDEHETAPNMTVAVRSLSSARQVAAPGSEFHSIETGYQAVGLVLESVAGEDYSKILYTKIFRPLGMTSSGGGSTAFGSGFVMGSASFFGLTLPRESLASPFGAPSSYVVSTASDIGLFLSYVVAPEKAKFPPLPPSQAAKLLEPLIQGIPYASGWVIGEEGGSLTLTSEAAQGGFSSRMTLWPKEKAAVAILASEDSLLKSAISLPALVSSAKRIMLEGSADRPFPMGRLYILFAVMAFVNVLGLAFQTGGALRWAKDARGRAEAKGSEGALVFTTARTWVGLSVRILSAIFAPALLGLVLGRVMSWTLAFALEPGLAAWCAAACFFGLIRNAARLVWLGGNSSFRFIKGRRGSSLRRQF